MRLTPRLPLLRLTLLALACTGLQPALWAEIKADPALIDFGRQRQEKTVSATVQLTNTGKKPLTIDHVAADCSCTAATPEQKELAPGQSTKMEVSFQTRSYQGEVHRRVTVDTSDGQIVVAVQAMVSAFDHWSLPAAITILPPSNRGTEANTVLALEYTGEGTATVKSMESSVPWLKAEVTEHDKNTTKITLTKVANAPAGNHQPTLTVHTTDTHESELKLPVFASIYSTLTVRPTPLLLPEGKVGTAISMPGSLSGWEAKEDPRFEVALGKATVRQRDHGEVSFDLTVTPTEAGTSTQLLRIYAGDELEAEIPVIVRAEP